jgi:hypothetical protein
MGPPNDLTDGKRTRDRHRSPSPGFPGFEFELFLVIFSLVMLALHRLLK